ncbi:hypothetical protein JW935_16870 [candidate division KSB1 bacterium]|nr:hypothetical protein [candidate division KSB1 bacterium]
MTEEKLDDHIMAKNSCLESQFDLKRPEKNRKWKNGQSHDLIELKTTTDRIIKI